MNQFAMKSAWKKFAPLINIPYEVQLQMKEVRAWNALKSFGSEMRKSNSLSVEIHENIGMKKSVPCAVEPIQASSIVNGYRNKLDATVGFDEEGKLVVGHTVNIGNTKKRKIIGPEVYEQLNKQNHISIIKVFEQYIREFSNYLPSKRNFEKYWRKIMIRSNRKNESMILINLNGALPPDTLAQTKNDLVGKLLPRLKNEHIDVRSLYFRLNSAMSDAEEIFPNQLLWGDKCITEIVCDKTFHIGPSSIFPVNVDVAEALYQSTRRLVKESDKSSLKKTLLIDLSCKNGAMGIVLSDFVDKVIGVDIIPSAIQDSKHNAFINNISNIEHICEDVEDFIPNFVNSEAARSYDDIIVIVRPGKMGLSTQFFMALRKCPSVKMVLVISSQIENSHISNLYQFCKVNESPESGDPFKLIKAFPLDSFPHTTDVDLMLQLMR